DVLFEIFVDADSDDVSDYVVINWNQSQASGAIDPSDVFVAVVIDLRSDATVATHPIGGGALFGATALALPVAAGDLGLTPGHSRISYYLVAFQRENFSQIDSTSIHSFDPAAPTLSLGGPPLVDDRDGASAQVRVNRASWVRDGAPDLLLLHELNAAPAQA